MKACNAGAAFRDAGRYKCGGRGALPQDSPHRNSSLPGGPEGGSQQAGVECDWIPTRTGPGESPNHRGSLTWAHQSPIKPE